MGALGDRRFRRLLAGNSISSFGDSALYLSLGVWAKDLTGSNAAAGAVFVALGLPYLLFPLAGNLADRHRRRPTLIASNAFAAVAVLGLLAVHSAGQLWLLLTVAFAYGTASVLTTAAGAGLIKDLLDDADLVGANTASTTISQGLRVVSPLAGTAIYTHLGGGSLALFDVATFVVAIATLLSVRIDEHPTGNIASGRITAELAAGAAHLARTPLLAQITRSACLAMAVLGFYESVTFAAIAALGRPPSFFGTLMAVQAAGSIAGGLATGRIIRRVGEARTLGVALAIWAAASLIYLHPSLANDVTALAAFGTAIPLYAVAINTATQRHTPPHLQGRATAAIDAATTLTQTLSIAIGAALIDTIGYPSLLATVAVITAIAAAPVLFHPAPLPRTHQKSP